MNLVEQLQGRRITGHRGDELTTCCVCGAPLNADGINCTRINGPSHDDLQSDYYGPEHERGWRARYHTQAEAENAPPISFLIAGFLQREGVTAIAGPVRERKSLIALNVAHSLLTGEKLFDHFEVVKKPRRVLYLCPEVSLGPFTDRVKKIGLMDYVGRTFFYRTLSAEGHVKLSDLKEELRGSAVFL